MPSLAEMARQDSTLLVVKRAQAASPPLIEPHYRNKPSPPNYPRKARRKRQQGTVFIRILVSPAAENLEVNVHRSSGFELLDQTAVDAVTAWQLEPASLAGKCVLAWVEVPVEFKLR